MQLFAHVDDPVRHRLDVALPLLKHGLVVQDQADDARSKRRRVRDLLPLQDQQLRPDPVRAAFRVARVRRDNVERADPLAVQPRVLGVRLAYEQGDRLGDKLTDRPRVVVEVAGREPLVRAVEKGKVLLLLEDLGNLFPLLARRVDAGRVVRARVQEEDGLFRRFPEKVEERRQVEADRFRVVVRVIDRGQADAVEDGLVVRWRPGIVVSVSRVSRGSCPVESKEDSPHVGFER